MRKFASVESKLNVPRRAAAGRNYGVGAGDPEFERQLSNEYSNNYSAQQRGPRGGGGRMMTKADVLKQKIQQERQREQLGNSLERQNDAFQQPMAAPNSDR